jgi:hypothetical protein
MNLDARLDNWPVGSHGVDGFVDGSNAMMWCVLL